MKLHADRLDGPNAITRHGPGGILVNGVEHRSSSIVPWLGEVTAWQVDHFAQLTQAHFTTLAQWKPEVIIFGSGERLRFVAVVPEVDLVK